ncbi:methyltransferase family protein [Liberiplasma polymorphum]|uniref:methyltransferase family protein n=1 Tax=Liberiplasma polymorphum TaxID=3374570 RepID=UPI0037765A48
MFWIVNLITLIISTLGLGYYYGHSVQPFCKQAKYNEDAFKKCGDYRLISGIFEIIIFLNYLVFFIVEIPRLPNIFNNQNYAHLIGMTLFIFGMIIMLISMQVVGLEVNKKKSKLTMLTGIYKYIRHPKTLGTMLVWFGVATASNRLFLVLFTIILSLIYIYITYLEEDDLMLKYGDDYIKYRENTGRFLPRFKK